MSMPLAAEETQTARAPRAPGVPSHVGLIMDGNGRWAAARGLPRIEGHRRGLEALRQRVGHGAVVSTSGHRDYIVSPAGVSKGSSLAALAAAYGCTPEEVMAIGDGVNDVEMFRAAGVSVAVANAATEAADAATLITKNAVGKGATEAVRRLMVARVATRFAEQIR